MIIDADCKQVIYYVKFNLTYTNAVSFVEIEAEIFLKTIIPSRKLPQTVNWFMSLEDAKNKIET